MGLSQRENKILFNIIFKNFKSILNYYKFIFLCFTSASIKAKAISKYLIYYLLI